MAEILKASSYHEFEFLALADRNYMTGQLENVMYLLIEWECAFEFFWRSKRASISTIF